MEPTTLHRGCRQMTTRDTGLDLDPVLRGYHFYRDHSGNYDAVRSAFEWEIPESFNAVTYTCDRWADADPDRVAMVAVAPDGDDTEYTFGELQTAANRLANYLAAHGVEGGDRIAVSGAQKVESLITLFATWKLGAIAVPLSVRFGPDGLRYRLTDSEVTAFVVDDVSLPALQEIQADCAPLETVLTISETPAETAGTAFWSAIDGHSSQRDTAATRAGEPATVLYTSGTTGDPKGVVLPHRTLLGVLPSHLLQARNMAIHDTDLGYSPAEWSWVGPLYQGILASLYYGTPVLGDADPRFDPERTFELLTRYGVTYIGGATTVYRMMMQVPNPSERFDLSSLRVVVGAGEPLGQTVVEWWRDIVEDVAIHEAYGQTEAGIVAGDCEALDVHHQPGSLGRPNPGFAIDVVDETGASRPYGDVGELAIRYDGNPGCFTAYWNAQEKTAQKVHDGWLFTEDMATMAEDGYISFHSRKDDVIISSGYRIGPGEIEESLASHDAVANAGVIGVPDETRGEVPKAFVALSDEYHPSSDLEAELQAYVKDRLAKHEYPRALEFIDELPKTTTGKVRRHDLRERADVGKPSSTTTTTRRSDDQ